MWGCHEQPALTKQTNFQPEPLLTEGVSNVDIPLCITPHPAYLPQRFASCMANAGVWVHVTVVQIVKYHQDVCACTAVGCLSCM